MTERAFLADAREAKGLNDGSITRIVRVIDPQPIVRAGRVVFWTTEYDCPNLGEPEGEWRVRASRHYSFRAPGGRLFVKEQWAVHGKHLDSTSELDIHTNLPHYEIWRYSQCYDGYAARFNLDFLGKWREAKTMPCHNGCLLLDLTDVRVIRVRDISLEDIEACGVTASTHATPVRGQPCEEYAVGGLTFGTPRYAFRSLWPEAVWDANDYVWIGTVKRTRKGTA